MRIATWNLARCRPGESARAARLLELRSLVDADVWVLTETHREFSPGAGYRLVSQSADAPDRVFSRGECWTAIWSRLPAEPVALTADLERVAGARVQSSVTVVGTVLPWLTDLRTPGLRGEAAFKTRLAEQATDWRRLREELGPLCVAGDFNQDLRMSGHYYGSAGGRVTLRSTLASLDLECLTGGADDPLSVSGRLACIDHICVSGLRAIGTPRSTEWPAAGTLRKGLTDHYGYWADLVIG
jgi:hypothetical protein